MWPFSSESKVAFLEVIQHMLLAPSSAVMAALLRHWLMATEGTGYTACLFTSVYPVPASSSGPARCCSFSVLVSADPDGLFICGKSVLKTSTHSCPCAAFLSNSIHPPFMSQENIQFI